jgi:diadenosine tetraphosphate (Ap4A) HIT family hydrolase
MFQLHARLAEDSVHIADLPLSQLRLARDARFPWAILVPAKPGLREVHDLAPKDQGRLMADIVMVSQALERLHGPDKINLGALGNLVPQLHVHVIARFLDDAAWPGPVWGVGTAEAYGDEDLAAACQELKAAVGTAAV